MHFHAKISIFIQFLHRGNSISSYRAQTINFCLKISVLDDNEERRYSVPLISISIRKRNPKCSATRMRREIDK